MECSPTNQYLRQELTNLRSLRKQITSGFITELQDKIDTNELYINAIASPYTTVIIEYNACIDYNAKIAINKTL